MATINSHLLFFLFLSIIVAKPVRSQADIDLIKQRITQELTAGKIDDAEITHLLETIREDGTWPGINYQDVSRTAFEHRYHYGHMFSLARAYRSPSSAYHNKRQVKQSIAKALKHWAEKDYVADNWWYNQIGTPNALVSVMLLVGDELDKQLVLHIQPMIRRAHIDAPGARPGGDRIKIASIEARNQVFLGEWEAFDRIIRVIESEIKFSDWVGASYGYGFRHMSKGFSNRKMGGRGIMHDHSFHHRTDGVNNTLSYGLGYAAAFVEWARYTQGTSFAFSEAKLEQLIDYFLDGICKMAVFGKYPDAGVKNRSISRVGALRPYGASLAEDLLLISPYRKDELQEIVAIRKKGDKPTLSHASWFWHTEHFTCQRPDWFASIRMYSTRTHNMEQPYNSEGLFNHHRGDGANHISRTGDEYLDIWPVYDYQKIPGATILQKPELPSSQQIQQLGLTDFVGAATDGRYGAAAFDFRSPLDPLIARKAWFFFDEEYVCLGAGISCKNQKLPVLTTLNQCHLRDAISLSVSGETSILATGEAEYQKVDWVYHDQIGYLFPQAGTVHIKNIPATGSWWRINKQTDSPKDELNLDVFSLWLDHGIRPSDAAYAYIVVPATSIQELEQGSSNNNIRILTNTPELQAVSHKGLGMTQVVFYQAGKIELPDALSLACEMAGVVLLQRLADNQFQLTVSDPNRELGKIVLSISRRVKPMGENVRTIWDEKKQVSDILIDLPQGQYAGSSVSVRVGLE
ncbi:MAG: polysaccharide lyase family 8 super-sandwich domain-containing protein [Bacteroidota bacterium]